MSRVNVDLDVLRESFGDTSLQDIDESLLRLRLTSPSIVLSDVKLRAGARSNLEVSVFNGEKDRDEDAVYARPTGAAPPHISFAAQQAWLKYKLRAKVDAGSVRKTALLASTTASREVELSDYRVHDGSEGVWGAVAGDLQAPRSILDLADVRRLQPSEALAIKLGGEITASVTFDVVDALSTTMAELVSEFPVGIPIAVRTSASLAVTANVKVSDDFVVIISRHEGRSYRFSIRKGRSDSRRFGIDVDLGASVSGAPWVNAAIDALLEASAGVRQAQVEQLDARLAARVADRLGLRGRTVEAVRRALNRLISRLRTRLRAAVTWKAATGFTYEYSRIEENTALADFVLLDDSQLEHDYRLAMAGDLATLLPLLRSERQTRRVVRYLNEAMVTQRASGGFSLGLGRWAVKTRDERVFRQATRTSIDGFSFVTSYGAHKYEEVNVPQNEIEWAIELKADSTEFLERPTTDTLDYGLHYQVELERRSLSLATLRRMVDFATMWDVAPSIDLRQFDIADGKAATVRIQLLFPRPELEATLRAAKTGDAARWTAALAAATPYHDAYDERCDLARRREIYTPVWAAWLDDQDWKPELKRRLHSGLINFENRRLPLSFAWTVEAHPHLRRNIDRFSTGAHRLLGLMTSASEPGELATAYAELQAMWSQRLYVAASGCYLLACARAAGVLDRVGRTMRIDTRDQTLTISSRPAQKASRSGQPRVSW
ncbi:MAG: hypothetical protein WA208_11675 [Thermoanaerobaculia bacterium]